jgi:hypothetical protein
MKYVAKIQIFRVHKIFSCRRQEILQSALFYHIVWHRLQALQVRAGRGDRNYLLYVFGGILYENRWLMCVNSVIISMINDFTEILIIVISTIFNPQAG